jgi:hypothetical protein
MINASEYRAMAAEHHRLAGMCRSPESREQHFCLDNSSLWQTLRNACTGRTPRNLLVSRSSQIGYVDAQRGLQTLISAM